MRPGAARRRIADGDGTADAPPLREPRHLEAVMRELFQRPYRIGSGTVAGGAQGERISTAPIYCVQVTICCTGCGRMER